MPLTFGGNPDMPVTTVGDGLTDAQAQSRTLYKVIQLYETLKDTGLFLFGDTGTGILTIEQQPVNLSLFIKRHPALIAIPHLDMPLMGIFHGIGREVREDLLHASLVKG